MNFKKLIGLCEHKWKIISWNDVADENKDKIGEKYRLQCELCGDIKCKIL